MKPKQKLAAFGMVVYALFVTSQLFLLSEHSRQNPFYFANDALRNFNFMSTVILGGVALFIYHLLAASLQGETRTSIAMQRLKEGGTEASSDIKLIVLGMIVKALPFIFVRVDEKGFVRQFSTVAQDIFGGRLACGKQMHDCFESNEMKFLHKTRIPEFKQANGKMSKRIVEADGIKIELGLLCLDILGHTNILAFGDVIEDAPDGLG